MNKDCIANLIDLNAVEGAFLGHQDGRIISHAMPEHLGLEQLQKSAKLLNQNRMAASAAVGQIKRCEFRYNDFTFLVYYLEQGELFVMCRPQANPQRIDMEVESCLNDLTKMLATATTTPKKGQGSNIEHDEPLFSVNEQTLPDQDKNRPGRGQALSEENTQASQSNSKRSLVMLVLLALLIVAGGTIYFLVAPGGTPPESDIAAISEAPVNQNEPPQTSPEPVPQIQETTILRLHGSNTIGAKLGPALAREFLKRVHHATAIDQRNGPVADEQVVIGTLKDGKKLAIEIAAHGSSTAFKGLDLEKCDIGMASRPIKDKEVEQLKRFGTMDGPACEHVLALDGIAVIINPANGVTKLTQQQIADIFSGKTLAWVDIPGSNLKGNIRVIARDEKSGTWDTFKNLVLRGAPLKPEAERIEDSRVLTDLVSKDSQAIGFIGLPYIKPSKAIAVSEKGTAAVYPTTFTVATEDYPLARRLFIYISATPTNTYVRPFVEFALSEYGQRVAGETGFVELTIDKTRPQVSEGAPDKYLLMATNASRLSLNFRFNTGGSQLDNRGVRDIERLVSFLEKPENRNRTIHLLGFTDSTGDRKRNCQLSQNRAEQVANILQSYGIVPKSIVGLCDDMPIASNETAAGRQKNRRVEIWLQN